MTKKKDKSGIELVFDGELYFKVTEKDGSVQNIPVPEKVIKPVLSEFLNDFMDRALDSYLAKKPSKKK